MGVNPLSTKLPLASFINKELAGAVDFLAYVASILLELYNLLVLTEVSTISAGFKAVDAVVQHD